MKTEHQYADILRAIADGETEFEQSVGTVWYPLSISNALISIAAASGNTANAYRIKPKTININGYEVPEPMRIAPAASTTYWRTALFNTNWASRYEWANDDMDNRWLKLGICHLNKEAAELHHKALLSFTEVKE